MPQESPIFTTLKGVLKSAADIKIEILVLVRSLKSSSFQMGETFWGVVSAAVKLTWLLRETGNSAPEADSRIPPNPKKGGID